VRVILTLKGAMCIGKSVVYDAGWECIRLAV